MANIHVNGSCIELIWTQIFFFAYYTVHSFALVLSDINLRLCVCVCYPCVVLSLPDTSLSIFVHLTLLTGGVGERMKLKAWDRVFYRLAIFKWYFIAVKMKKKKNLLLDNKSRKKKIDVYRDVYHWQQCVYL